MDGTCKLAEAANWEPTRSSDKLQETRSVLIIQLTHKLQQAQTTKSTHKLTSYSLYTHSTPAQTTLPWLGSLTVACRTSDREVAGSTPGRSTAR